jgi:hypothetical protein
MNFLKSGGNALSVKASTILSVLILLVMTYSCGSGATKNTVSQGNETEEKVVRQTDSISDQSKLPGDPIYVIDGKIVNQETFKKIDPKNISSISVLSNEDAEKKYGKEGEKGVVEIILSKK